MKNELFNYLLRAGIFKNNSHFDFHGNRIEASEKTEQKRKERNRSKFAWLSANANPLTSRDQNRGTFRGSARKLTGRS